MSEVLVAVSVLALIIVGFYYVVKSEINK